ncbi:MAG: hypothetical protein KC646_13300 [Candidatus Cloacimonetes bacterium]|nr:hypothetical protein [Candidatus Cloacimonadota bacterium]
MALSCTLRTIKLGFLRVIALLLLSSESFVINQFSPLSLNRSFLLGTPTHFSYLSKPSSDFHGICAPCSWKVLNLLAAREA